GSPCCRVSQLSPCGRGGRPGSTLLLKFLIELLPQGTHLPDPLGLLGCEVARFDAILLQVVELPFLPVFLLADQLPVALPQRAVALGMPVDVFAGDGDIWIENGRRAPARQRRPRGPVPLSRREDSRQLQGGGHENDHERRR